MGKNLKTIPGLRKTFQLQFYLLLITEGKAAYLEFYFMVVRLKID
jgi:hypothetical protein